ncbi:hypothetical protein Y032_0074g883 [Ancylostoma ceylanicum]|uniref:Uncharacterized protein n=1 Tax=Ancylostoma ceylanicum TaxID=53326 RepID=A0A016TUQ9_9BILA|nr:hypothetical protein Y032_0074g883 [Ancylostoma ceylanicum]
MLDSPIRTVNSKQYSIHYSSSSAPLRCEEVGGHHDHVKDHSRRAQNARAFSVERATGEHNCKPDFAVPIYDELFS